MPNQTKQSDRRYPEEIRIDVDARVHLEHTDTDERSVEKVEGEIVSQPNEGTYQLSLAPKSGRPFALFTGIPCVILIVVFVLDWPKPANEVEEKKRTSRDLPPPRNFLDLSPEGYGGRMRLTYDDGYAYKRFEVTRVEEDHYEATIESVHRYPSGKSADLVRLLPHDIVLVDGGPGRLLARTQMRMLAEDGSIETGDGEIDVRFENEHARLCSPEVYSYEYSFGDLDEVPLEIDARGVMRAVDTGPEPARFEKSRLARGRSGKRGRARDD